MDIFGPTNYDKMQYKKIKFPDGQISVKVDYKLGDTVIRERINSYEDLFTVKAVAEVMSSQNSQKPSLYIPCLFGQRSDRRFESRQSFDLKIIADFINSCNFQRVSILDPHSDVSLALINNSYKISSFEYVQKAVTDIYQETAIGTSQSLADVVLVSPDAGAYKKVFEYGEKLRLPVVAANKFRSKAGEVELHFLGDVKGKDCLIVDDLCDGGYTFLQLGKALKEQGAKSVRLYVSHGYFSKGFVELRKVIDHIYCTNSVKDLPSEVDDDEGHYLFETKEFVTQFKVI